MQNFVKIEKGIIDNEIYLKMYISKYKHKRPFFLSVTAILNHHNCQVCSYAHSCGYQCSVIEGSRSVQGYVKREFGCKKGEFSITPVCVERV